MPLIRTVEQIKKMYLERSDSLDASSYEVSDLCEEIERLQADNAALRKTLAGVKSMHADALEECQRLRKLWKGSDHADLHDRDG